MPRLTLIKACVIFSSVVLGTAGVSFGDSVTFGMLGPVNIAYSPGNAPTNGVTSTAGPANALVTTDSGSLAGLTYTGVVMTLTGLDALGSATTVPMGSSAELIIQNLTSGSFTLSAGSQILLSGTVSDSYVQLFGAAGKAPTTGSFNAGSVSYTGGALADLFGANQLLNTGDFSFGLGGLTGNVGTSSKGGYLELNGFTATASGLFDADVAPSEGGNPDFAPTVPLPASVWMGFSTLGSLGILGILGKRSTTP